MKKALIIIRKIDKYRKKRAKQINKKISFEDHFKVAFSSFLFGLIFLIFINVYVLPKQIPLPDTSAINYFTINNHSMILDYLRFMSIIFVIPSSVVIGWIIFIWKKDH